MASSKDYLEFILERLSGLDGVNYRPMMGEYIIYYKGKVIGGIYDDRFLVKATKKAAEFMPDASYEIPYDTGKPMLLVDNVDDKDYLFGLFQTMYEDLPEPKKRK